MCQTMSSRQMTSTEESGLLSIITEYAYTWALLQKYDKNELTFTPPLSTCTAVSRPHPTRCFSFAFAPRFRRRDRVRCSNCISACPPDSRGEWGLLHDHAGVIPALSFLDFVKRSLNECALIIVNILPAFPQKPF